MGAARGVPRLEFVAEGIDLRRGGRFFVPLDLKLVVERIHFLVFLEPREQTRGSTMHFVAVGFLRVCETEAV